jgi:(2Fe-2S) ferredoxin
MMTKYPQNKDFEKLPSKSAGNAMIYVLIALALFGFLTITLSSQNDQADGQDIDDEQAALYANELISYVASAQQVVDMMLATGSEIDDLDFVNPTSGGFDTPPHHHKVFHPAGGGLNYVEKFSADIQNDATSVWAVNNSINVEWTPTASNDVIISSYFITKQICENINKKITGSTAIPITASPHDEYFLSTGTTDFDTTECAICDGKPTLCVENDTNDNYTFYSIIVGQ